MSSEVLSAFRFAEDSFVLLTWEDVFIFPHENYQSNLLALYGAMKALEDGDTTTAIDDYLWLVDNNFYAYDWSREVFDYYTNYVLNQPADRLMWGAGRVQGHIDLFDVIASLGEKYDTTESVEAELAIIADYVKAHEADMVKVVAQQIADIEALTVRLEKIAA